MKTVFFLSPAPPIELIQYYKGINAVALDHHWNLQRMGGLRTARDVRKLVDFWKPQGCIVQCAVNDEIFPADIFRRIPHVYIDRDPARLGRDDLAVLHDTAETGRIAARELLSLGLVHFAFARASKNPFWCRERQQAFVQALRLNGADCSISGDVDHDQNRTHAQLRRWIQSLPKPVGVFAANDRTAELVVSAANELGIAIPQDLALISVDNCEGICENTSPTLTSIPPRFSDAGRLAAELLARKFAQPDLKGITLRYGQNDVVRRESLRRFHRRDARVTAIAEYIRRHASDPGMSFADIAAVAGCSLRCAEIHFRQLTGKTILDELHERRIDMAKRLLEQTDLRISEVAEKSGFSSLATFARVFQRLVDQSPRAWRRRVRGKITFSETA